jgi:hypothetical protein
MDIVNFRRNTMPNWRPFLYSHMDWMDEWIVELVEFGEVVK